MISFCYFCFSMQIGSKKTIFIRFYQLFFRTAGFQHKLLILIVSSNMNDIFKLRENTYNLRNFHIFESENPRTKRFGLDCIAYRASQLWKNVPVEIRNSNSLTVFKEKIKKVPLIPCSCNCCRKYIHHVGFI